MKSQRTSADKRMLAMLYEYVKRIRTSNGLHLAL